MEITLVRVKKCKMFCFALFQQFEEVRLYNILFQNGKNKWFFNKEFGIISVNSFLNILALIFYILSSLLSYLNVLIKTY